MEGKFRPVRKCRDDFLNLIPCLAGQTSGMTTKSLALREQTTVIVIWIYAETIHFLGLHNHTEA